MTEGVGWEMRDLVPVQRHGVGARGDIPGNPRQVPAGPPEHPADVVIASPLGVGAVGGHWRRCEQRHRDQEWSACKTRKLRSESAAVLNTAGLETSPVVW